MTEKLSEKYRNKSIRLSQSLTLPFFLCLIPIFLFDRHHSHTTPPRPIPFIIGNGNLIAIEGNGMHRGLKAKSSYSDSLLFVACTSVRKLTKIYIAHLYVCVCELESISKIWVKHVLLRSIVCWVASTLLPPYSLPLFNFDYCVDWKFMLLDSNDGITCFVASLGSGINLLKSVWKGKKF